eukprot:3196739-Prorocentrum_lima.AAC.1
MLGALPQPTPCSCQGFPGLPRFPLTQSQDISASAHPSGLLQVTPGPPHNLASLDTTSPP